MKIDGLIENLKTLYTHEINFEITSFWDSGYSVGIGDTMNGFLWRECYDSLEEALTRLNHKINSMLFDYKNTNWIPDKEAKSK